MTELSAAGGRYSEAEEEKNKENHEALQASEVTIFFSVAVGYVQSTSATPTIKTKSGNTRCSLTFFFVLYGFVASRKINRIEKVTVHPITFPTATASAENKVVRQISLYFKTHRKKQFHLYHGTDSEGQ